jgi:hypothetical protein
MNLPMTVDAVVVYLGLVLAGCVVVSIADSFAADEASRPASRLLPPFQLPLSPTA